MVYRFLLGVFSSLLIALGVWAEDTFQLGRDYQMISQPVTDVSSDKKGRVEIIEFFSYYCPACYRLNPIIQEWVEAQKDNIEFIKIPVLFRAQWEPLARAYYIAEAYGIEHDLDQALFSAVQRENRKLTTPEEIAPFFEKYGVSSEDFMNAYNFSSQIDIKLQRGRNLLQQYAVFEIPTLVVNGQYVTNPGMVNGDRNRLFAVLNYLVEQAKLQTQ